MEETYEELVCKIDNLSNENANLRKELQNSNDRINHIWNILQKAGFLNEDGEIKDSISQKFMSKKMRKEQMIKKTTTSFVNKAQKWIKDNNHSIKSIKEEKKDALNRACQECINNGIFELQNLDDCNWHTKSKCPQRGLHLVIHNYKWKNGQRGYEKCYTIIEDKRFIVLTQMHTIRWE